VSFVYSRAAMILPNKDDTGRVRDSMFLLNDFASHV